MAVGRAPSEATAPLPSAGAPSPGPVDGPTSRPGGPAQAPPVAYDLIERFAEANARHRQEWKRYPRNSRALAPGAPDPVLEARRVTQRERRAADDQSLGFTFYLSTMNLLPDRELLLYGVVRRADQRVRVQAITATVMPSDKGTTPYTVELNDDGRNGDEAGGDLLYTGSFRPPAGESESFKGAHTVQALAVVDGNRIPNSAGFLYSIPKSTLTGQFRDEMVDKSLVVHAMVEVWKESRFHLEATIYGGDPPQAIGWAQNAATLPRGKHEIDLVFYGLMFYEAGIDGPYLLRYVSLRTTEEMPNDLSDMLVDAYRTQAYKASDFTDQPFSSLDAGAPVRPELP